MSVVETPSWVAISESPPKASNNGARTRMNKPKNEPKPVREPRLPEGYDMETLCALKGQWPKREPSQDELQDTYKAFYSGGSRGESLLLLKTFQERFGPAVLEVLDDLYYRLGQESGVAEKALYGNLLNKMVDMFARPHCYENDHLETSEERIVVRVTKCPFANLAKEMGMEEIAQHICLPWHEAYAKEHGYKITFTGMLLTGDDCCYQTWEKVGE